MKLLEFEEIGKFDDEVNYFRTKALKMAHGKGSIGEKADSFRTKVRRKIKTLANYTNEFTGGNGQSNFVDWADGFKFAASLPPGVEVVKYIRYRHSINAAFFYKQESIDAAYQLLEKLKSEFEELKKLAGVFEVMNS